jgi:hypothetical protein
VGSLSGHQDEWTRLGRAEWICSGLIPCLSVTVTEQSCRLCFDTHRHVFRKNVLPPSSRLENKPPKIQEEASGKITFVDCWDKALCIPESLLGILSGTKPCAFQSLCWASYLGQSPVHSRDSTGHPIWDKALCIPETLLGILSVR